MIAFTIRYDTIQYNTEFNFNVDYKADGVVVYYAAVSSLGSLGRPEW